MEESGVMWRGSGVMWRGSGVMWTGSGVVWTGSGVMWRGLITKPLYIYRGYVDDVTTTRDTHAPH